MCNCTSEFFYVPYAIKYIVNSMKMHKNVIDRVDSSDDIFYTLLQNELVTRFKPT
jgi:hypothetical protein